MMLDGVRVVECSQVLSAPYAGAILRDLGADVIKVEKPPRGDDARAMGAAFRDDAAMNFTDVNRGKTSIMIDVRTEAGRARLLGLLAEADVFIHNFRPGDAERYRLDGATLTGLFPRLIYCGISAFGHVGPRRLLPGYEPLLQAYSGLVAMNGTPGAPPSRIPASLVDQGTGMWTVIGALSLLQRRARTGRGGIVSASLLETAMTWGRKRSMLI